MTATVARTSVLQLQFSAPISRLPVTPPGGRVLSSRDICYSLLEQFAFFGKQLSPFFFSAKFSSFDISEFFFFFLFIFGPALSQLRSDHCAPADVLCY